MEAPKTPRVLSERQARWILNLFPPLLFNRIRVLSIEPGFRACRVRIARSLLTRNLNGSTFGGTIFSAADPYYAVMYWQVLARMGYRVQAWLSRATIEYRRPAATALTLEFRLGDDDVRRAVEGLQGEGRFRRLHVTDAVDRHGRTCASIETEVYLRLPRQAQKDVSAF
jgi:acyl-coenzyme A thioesterase PaaI-like protein